MTMTLFYLEQHVKIYQGLLWLSFHSSEKLFTITSKDAFLTAFYHNKPLIDNKMQKLRVVNLNVAWLGFVILISFIHMYGAVVVRVIYLILDAQGQMDRRILHYGVGFLKIEQLKWTSYVYHHSHKYRKDSLETWAAFYWILMLTLNFLCVIVTI